MNGTGSFICDQHDKLMVKMTLFLLDWSVVALTHENHAIIDLSQQMVLWLMFEQSSVVFHKAELPEKYTILFIMQVLFQVGNHQIFK